MMMLSTGNTDKMLQWSEELSVNNVQIDNQHKQLINLKNELCLHSKSNINSEIVNETLYKLLEYTKHHFRDEEKLLEAYHYPKLKEHKKLHSDFLYKIVMFSKDVADRKATVTEDLLAFLSEWILQHVAVDDQDYKKYL